jgi:hypothetical protein
MNLARGMILPARPISLKFGAVLSNLPEPPARFGHYGLVTQSWGMLGNNHLGSCVPCGYAHETMLLGAMAGHTISFNETVVSFDYRAMNGNQPWPLNDRGTDIQQGAEWRRTRGIHDINGIRHRIDAYAELPTGDVHALMQAVNLLGVAGVGLSLPSDADQEFEDKIPWSSTRPAPGAGHYVCAVGRNSAGNILVVTWGYLHAMSPAFFEKYNSISLAYLSREQLNGQGLSPDQYNADKLREFIGGLGTL